MLQINFNAILFGIQVEQLLTYKMHQIFGFNGPLLKNSRFFNKNNNISVEVLYSIQIQTQNYLSVTDNFDHYLLSV